MHRLRALPVVVILSLTACQCGGPTGPSSVDARGPRYDGGSGADGGGLDASAGDTSGHDQTNPADAATPDQGMLDTASSDTVVPTDSATPGDSASATDAASSDTVSTDAGHCSQACAAEGASRCEGNAVVHCELQNGCLVWGAPQSCTGGTSCSDGRCRVQCSDECSESGATRCASSNRFETCGQHDGDACLEWGAGQACPGSQVCASGVCQTACADACTAPGARRCSGASVEQCGDLNGDGCLDWGLLLACDEDETCSLGVCAPRCDDECTTAGARECDGAGARQCGNYDTDACLEWGTTVACPGGTSCSGGVCQANCFDECSPAGALGCQGNATRRCGNHDTDACLEWGTAEPCATGTACAAGVCALTCQDECTRPGEVACHLGGTHSCGNYDDDPCLEWSDVLPCAGGTSCSGGVCLPSCSDECSAGQQRCVGTATYQTCARNFDLDPCLDWSPPLACPLSTPSCAESTPNAASCVAQCQDLCNPDTAITCYDGTATIACVEQLNGCYEWLIRACDANQACMGDSCASCAPDGREPNNTQAMAAAITSLPYTNSNLSICAKDEDWFRYTAAAGENLEIAIRFSHALGDLDIKVFDPAGSLAGWGMSMTDDEVVPISNTLAGTYLIQVYGFSSMANLYSLEVTRYTCSDDGLEPNDSATQATALPAAPVTRTGLELCRGNEDWFRYSASQGEGLHIELIETGSGGSLGLEVFDPDGTSLGAGQSTGSGKQIDVGSMVTGNYLILVDGGWNQGANSYTLSLGAYSCPSDAQEPNNSAALAKPISVPATIGSLQICAADHDWFVYSAAQGDSVQVEARFLQSDGDLDLHAYNARLQTLDSGISASDNETVVLYHLDAGDYYFEVEGWLDQETAPYQLVVSAATGCNEDIREPNDSSGTATHITALPYGLSGLTLCNPDEDWFSIDATEGLDLQVQLLFSDAGGNIDLSLYDAQLRDIGHSFSFDDNELVTLYDLAAGRYYILVDGPGTRANSYDLSVAQAQPCPADALETNNSALTATTVAALPFQRQGLGICASDEDWFAYTASPGQNLRVTILFQDALADLDLRIYDNLLNVLDSSLSVSDNETVEVENTAAVTYYVKVVAFDGRSTSYDLVFETF